MTTATLTLEDIVSKSNDLPTLPAAAIAVIRESESTVGSARTVADLITRDQALSARVLRIANSAYYGMSRQVIDLQESVVLLGMRSVRNLAVIAATYPWMQKPLTGYALEPEAMWAHSFGVGVAAQLIAQKTRAVDPDFAFTAGLLHNVGKVAMSVWLDHKLTSVLNLAQRDHLAFDEVERKLLGFDHAEVGGFMAENWNLPESLVLPIRYHHRPNEMPKPELSVDVVHVADFLTMSMGFGLGADGLRYNFAVETLSRLRLSSADLDSISTEFIESYTLYEKSIRESNAA